MAGCEERHEAKGYCASHYAFWRRWGDPLARKRYRRSGTAVERFVPRVIKSDGCWTWDGSTDQHGYGMFNIGNGVRVRAHRFAYELWVGPIPEGLVLDHLCRNPNCVRPDHLEPVTHAENCRRGEQGWLSGLGQKAKTHCPQGHEYTPENTILSPATRGGGGPWRRCRACRNARERERRAKLRG